MSIQIIPSQQLLMISSESKQHFLFDPKTTSVLFKFHDDHPMNTNSAYYEPARQFFMAQNNRSFISVWDMNSQESNCTVSLGEIICFLEVDKESGLLFGGSVNGVVYIWELPTGILLRKFSAHTQKIRKVVMLKSIGKILTVSLNEAKLWTYFSLFIQEDDSQIAESSAHLPSDAISSCVDRNLLFTLHKNTVCIYSLESLILKEILDLDSNSNSTCFCLSRTSIYVGTNTGSISEYPLSNSLFSNQTQKCSTKELDYSEGEFQIMEHDRKKKREFIKCKHPVSSIAFVRSLGLLVSGSVQGQVALWENGKLKKSVQLYKTPINFITVLPRPQEAGVKIHLVDKIRALHKYQLSKEGQPLHMLERYENNEISRSRILKELDSAYADCSEKNENQEILARMMKELGQPYEIMKEEIEMLTTERDKLIERNLEYGKLIISDLEQQND